LVYRPTARVLTVLELLQSHGRMTGAELAQRLEVHIRTVRDYVATLQDLGIPVEAERGRYGAYRLRPGYKLPPLIFTEDEALALTLSLLVARQSGLAKTAPAFESVLAKVERVLPTVTRTRIQAVERTVSFEQNTHQTSPSSSAVMVLSSAVQHEQSVLLQYRAASSEATLRVFDPYGVVYHEGLWYTIGYCHLRQGQRLFRLDRVISVEVTNEIFTRPAGFQALAEVQQALASVPAAWQVEVWLETSLEEAQQQSNLSRAYFEEVNQGVLLHGDVDDLQWTARLLAGLAVPFIIHQPPELRDALRQHALNLANYAERQQERDIPGGQ